MADARIGGVAFIVIVERFRGVYEKDGVPVRPHRLQTDQAIGALRDAVRCQGLVAVILGIDFLAQDAAFQGAGSLAHLVIGKVGRQRDRRQ